MEIEQLAELAHEVNRAYCESTGDTSQPSWRDAPQWQKEATINQVASIMSGEASAPSDLPPYRQMKDILFFYTVKGHMQRSDELREALAMWALKTEFLDTLRNQVKAFMKLVLPHSGPPANFEKIVDESFVVDLLLEDFKGVSPQVLLRHAEKSAKFRTDPDVEIVMKVFEKSTYTKKFGEVLQARIEKLG